MLSLSFAERSPRCARVAPLAVYFCFTSLFILFHRRRGQVTNCALVLCSVLNFAVALRSCFIRAGLSAVSMMLVAGVLVLTPDISFRWVYGSYIAVKVLTYYSLTSFRARSFVLLVNRVPIITIAIKTNSFSHKISVIATVK